MSTKRATQAEGIPGQPVPPAALLVGGKSGADLQSVQVNPDGSLKVDPYTEERALADGRVNAPHLWTAKGADAVSIIALLYGFNGVTWDRLRLDAQKSLLTRRNGYTTQVIASGTANDVAAEVAFDIEMLAFLTNDGPDDLLISFDGGVNFFTLKNGEALNDQPIKFGSFHVRTAAAGETAAYRALGWR